MHGHRGAAEEDQRRRRIFGSLDGRIEAGATYQGSLTAMRRSKDVDPLSFRIIAKTERTPFSGGIDHLAQ